MGEVKGAGLAAAGGPPREQGPWGREERETDRV